jgi:hypothetical protein
MITSIICLPMMLHACMHAAAPVHPINMLCARTYTYVSGVPCMVVYVSFVVYIWRTSYVRTYVRVRL